MGTEEVDPNWLPANATLKLPPSFADRWDVASLARQNPRRALAAALGMCWRHHGRLKVKFDGESIAAYGGQVIDELLARPGVDYGDVMEAGLKAIEMIRESIADEEAIKEPAGKSPPADGSSERSSPSVASTDGAPDSGTS